MPDRKRMTAAAAAAVGKAYFVMATMFVATGRGADGVVVHAAVDLGAENSEFIQTLFKQMDMLVSKDQSDSNALSQGDSEMVAGLLQAAPSVTIKGNITDPERRLSLTFTVHASRSHQSVVSTEDDDDDDDEEDSEWRSSSGVLTPIVDVVEPYFLSFVELVVNGILSTVISNFLEGSNLLGDVRLV